MRRKRFQANSLPRQPHGGSGDNDARNDEKDINPGLARQRQFPWEKAVRTGLFNRQLRRMDIDDHEGCNKT